MPEHPTELQTLRDTNLKENAEQLAELEKDLQTWYSRLANSPVDSGGHPDLEGLGNYKKLARHIEYLGGAAPQPPWDIETVLLPDEPQHGPTPIDWTTFWDRTAQPEWLAEPLIPLGRLIALYATGKAGKSLLILEVAAALATGRPCLHQPAADPQDIIYLDQEMTEDDIWERMLDLGYTKQTDLSHLHYYQLQNIPPLDTPEGGQTLQKLIRQHQPALVVIDTVARLVEGEENSADTYKDLYRHSLRPAKSLGCAVVRLDHAGKDPTRGQRGSSAKNDDVDVVWRLQTNDSGHVTIKGERRRMGWVPDRIELIRVDTPYLRHIPTSAQVTPKIEQLAQLIQAMQIPIEQPLRSIGQRLREGGHKTRTQLLTDTVRWLRQGRETRSETYTRSPPPETLPETQHPRETGPQMSPPNGTFERETRSETRGNADSGNTGKQATTPEGVVVSQSDTCWHCQNPLEWIDTDGHPWCSQCFADLSGQQTFNHYLAADIYKQEQKEKP